MKRELPTMVMAMNRAVIDAQRFFDLERDRVLRELDARLHPRIKPNRQQRRQCTKESYEMRLQKRIKNLTQQ